MHKMWKVIKRNNLLPYLLITCITIIMFVRSRYHAVPIVLEKDITSEVIGTYDVGFTHENFSPQDKVTLKLFYETLCPSCMQLDPQFVKVVEKLYENIDVSTYPYGNARMTTNQNGSVNVECQHGESECYGNKLHACAIDVLKDPQLYLQYNACMMPLKSNDSAAEKCGKDNNVPLKTVRAIKNCAKSAKGHQLLVHYGKESQKVRIPFVPYVLINDAEWTQGDLMKAVCETFANPPAPCQEYV